MKLQRWADIKVKKLGPEGAAATKRAAERTVLEMNLRAVRELVGQTQAELAEATEWAQSELSRVERRDDHLVSTLRKYVEALGGELDVVARFQDKSIRLKGV